MPETIDCVVGADVSRVLTLLDVNGNAITTLSGSATLAAKVWVGDDQPVLFSPSVVWLVPSAGTITYSHTAAQTASLEPGYYQVQLSLGVGSVTYKNTIAVLHLSPSPGTAAVTPVYCTRKDLLAIAPWVESQEDLQNDQTNFARQCGLARQWLDNIIMDRVEEILNDQSRRHGPVLCVTPIIPTTGYDAGPKWGPSTIPVTTIRDQLAVFRGYLNSNMLMRKGYDATVPLDNGQVERIAGSYALYLILDAQLGAKDETSYQELGKQHLKRAIRNLAAWTALIDTDADGVPDFSIASL